jgi:hypothetical protein
MVEITENISWAENGVARMDISTATLQMANGIPSNIDNDRREVRGYRPNTASTEGADNVVISNSLSLFPLDMQNRMLMRFLTSRRNKINMRLVITEILDLARVKVKIKSKSFSALNKLFVDPKTVAMLRGTNADSNLGLNIKQ